MVVRCSGVVLRGGVWVQLRRVLPLQDLLKPGEQCWSLAELVQAVVLLAHCHSLCSFVFGSGADRDSPTNPWAPRGTPPGHRPCEAGSGGARPPTFVPDWTSRRRVSLSGVMGVAQVGWGCVFLGNAG